MHKTLIRSAIGLLAALALILPGLAAQVAGGSIGMPAETNPALAATARAQAAKGLAALAAASAPQAAAQARARKSAGAAASQAGAR